MEDALGNHDPLIRQIETVNTPLIAENAERRHKDATFASKQSYCIALQNQLWRFRFSQCLATTPQTSTRALLLKPLLETKPDDTGVTSNLIVPIVPKWSNYISTPTSQPTLRAPILHVSSSCARTALPTTKSKKEEEVCATALLVWCACVFMSHSAHTCRGVGGKGGGGCCDGCEARYGRC